MSQTTMEANAITSQPVMANMPNTIGSSDAAVVTTQPLMNEPAKEQAEEKYSQFNPSNEEQEKKKKRQDDEVDDDDCVWCCFTCLHSINGCDLGCADCCQNCGDCCTCCCEDGPSVDVGDVDGGDIAGCLECCGSCFECCND